MPAEIAYLYQTYDLDENGFLDITEFEPIAHKLLSVPVSLTFYMNHHIYLAASSQSYEPYFKVREEVQPDIDNDDEVLTLNAHFEPIIPDSMSNNLTEGVIVSS